MRERVVERRLTDKVRSRGGWSVKLLPSVAGLPDRIVLMPGGRAYFAELKAPTGRLSAVQRVIQHRLSSLGFSVVVLYSVAEVDAWVQLIEAKPLTKD